MRRKEIKLTPLHTQNKECPEITAKPRSKIYVIIKLLVMVIYIYILLPPVLFNQFPVPETF